jgi:hypothetical protein
MSNNAETIELIRQETSGVLEKLADRQVSSFKIKDLNFENGIWLKDKPLKGNALKSVLSMLKVRTGFVDYSHKMSPEDWTTVSKKIKAAEGETAMYAKIMKDDKGQEEIMDVFAQNNTKKGGDDASYRQYMEWITDSLGQTETSYSLKNFSFDAKHETFDITLLNNDRKVDVFGTDTDIWKLGDRFVFNSLRFDYAPFFERLVCANGNTANEFGFGANIAQAKFNNSKIQSTIESSIIHGMETMPDMLQQAVQHLKNNNISLQEFYQYRRFFEGRNENEKYNTIIDKYFNDQPFFQGYGLNIAEKSNKWKSTANTGINAYNFFNALTYIASHPDKVKVEHKDRRDLQIQASNLLFKKQLDLEDIATNIKIDYPVLSIMN